MKNLMIAILGGIFVLTPMLCAAPYGRAGVFAVEKDASGAEKVTSYAESVEPAPGRTLTVRADSNGPAIFLIAAFSRKDSTFLQGLAPLLVTCEKPFTEVSFPDLAGEKPEIWTFEEPEVSGELHILVFDLEDKRMGEIRDLVAATAKASVPKVRALLSKKLRTRISVWAGQQAKTGSRQRYSPPTVAATLRGNSKFPWQTEHSYKVPIPANGPAIFLFDIGPVGDSGEAPPERPEETPNEIRE